MPTNINRRLLINLLAVLFITFCCIIDSLYSQTLTNERAKSFIESLLKNDKTLREFVHPEELVISERLGVKYNDVKNKFLISYELHPQVVETINSGRMQYNYKIEQLENNFSALTFNVPDQNYSKSYYFEEEYLISPIRYNTTNWEKIESEHFIFLISNPDLFNQYSIERLESFLDELFLILNFSDEDTDKIKSEKIYYILCKDEEEIEQITAFKSRGMYNLAYDYVVTTFNCHYHELLHLLINFKLKQLPIYTTPFFQEGIAVALGGRGGKEPEVILNMGLFLSQSGFLNHEELFSKIAFSNYDASMTYPLSGLYNLFLLKEIGINEYMKLYLKYSGNSEQFDQIRIDEIELPSKKKWLSFLENYSGNNPIIINSGESIEKMIIEKPAFRIYENDSHYLIESKQSLLISSSNKPKNYMSKKFEEIFPGKEYFQDKYLIKIEPSEISIYNLYTNNLIANYSAGFSLVMNPVSMKGDYYTFSVRKSIFDESLKETDITVCPN